LIRILKGRYSWAGEGGGGNVATIVRYEISNFLREKWGEMQRNREIGRNWEEEEEEITSFQPHQAD